MGLPHTKMMVGLFFKRVDTFEVCRLVGGEAMFWGC